MILPALLTANERIAQERIAFAQHMSGWLHVDILDNTLYKFESLRLADLEKLSFGELSLEVHCMTDDPIAIVESSLSVDRVIIHVELPNWSDAYDVLVSRAVNTWLAISPSTNIADLDLPDDLSGLVVMGVIPGQSGQTFLPETFERIHQLKDYRPDIPVTVDGGVTGENIRELLASGADNVVMGNAIFNQPDPVAAYERYVAKMDPLGGLDDREAA
jgi:ribulose-phosphate 3-epimerase